MELSGERGREIAARKEIFGWNAVAQGAEGL
jgi:hypothetical protein